jgi:hypothetical protein
MRYLESLGQTPQQAMEAQQKKEASMIQKSTGGLTVNILKFGETSTAALKKLEKQDGATGFTDADYSEFYRAPEGKDHQLILEQQHVEHLRRASPVLAPSTPPENPSEPPAETIQ